MSSPQEIWEQFFQECGLPAKVRRQYAETFVTQRIQPNMLAELDKSTLKELGVHALGDQLAILRYIKQTDGVNAQAFKMIQTSSSSNKEPVTTSTSKGSSGRHVLARATSSSTKVPMASRSVVIQKKSQVVHPPRLSNGGGLRSDEILRERAVFRRIPTSYRLNRPTVSARPVMSSYAIIRQTQLADQDRRREREQSRRQAPSIRERISFARGRRYYYDD